MAIGAHSPTNTDRCGISGVSDDELEYHNRPHPSRRQYPSLPPRRLNSYPTEYHPEEAEDVRSVTTEPEELVPHANPIPFIAPPPSRAKYSTYPIQSTRETRYEAQRFLCGFHGTDYLQRYGTPSECCSDPECSDHLLDPILHSELHDDNDSMPELVTASDSSENEEENRWIRTKDFPESLVTKAKRIVLEKKRRMVRDRIDEKKRARILRAARDNEQGLEEGEIHPLCDREGTMPVATPTLDPRIRHTPEVLTITVLSSDPAAVRAATLDNERTGLNAIVEKAKSAVLCDEDMDVQSSTSDLEHNVVLEAMNSFIHDARHYRLINNHHPPTPSPWDEDRVAPNVDETHFRALQDGLDIIISDTPSSPSSDFISGQLQIFATRIPLYRRFRDRLVEALEYVRDCLTLDQWNEAIRETLNVYKESDSIPDRFVETLVDRFRWYTDNYPCLNTLFTIRESTFLRGASDTLRRHGRKRFSKSIDRLLNTPIPDCHIIAELLDQGYLESEDPNDYEALAFVKCRLEELSEDDDLEYVSVD